MCLAPHGLLLPLTDTSRVGSEEMTPVASRRPPATTMVLLAGCYSIS